MLRLTGEQPDQIADRVRQAIETITAHHPSGRVVVVTHWGVLNMVMASLVDRDPRVWKDHGPWAACGVTELHSPDGLPPDGGLQSKQGQDLSWRVVHLNDSAHLREESPT
jgi:broad specificity phosphatase PhoE